MQSVCVPDSAEMSPPGGCRHQKGGIVEAEWERGRAVATHGLGLNLNSIISQPGGFVEVPAPHLQWGIHLPSG